MIELEPLLQDVTTLTLVTVADGPAAGQGAAGSDGQRPGDLAGIRPERFTPTFLLDEMLARLPASTLKEGG